MCSKCGVRVAQDTVTTEAELLQRVQSLMVLLAITPSNCADSIEMMKMEASFLLEAFHAYRLGRTH